jgi:hypothetical protein
MTDLHGFLFPQSRTGKASILPNPPWHYVGDLLTIRFRTDPDALRHFLPDGIDLDPQDAGTAAIVFADWQSCSDSEAELLDPVMAQYREAYIDVSVVYDGDRYGRVILIWVDKDFAMLRGHVQGYPKRLGAVSMTRPAPFGIAAPKLEPGGRFGATLSSNGRLLADAIFTITEQADDGSTSSPALPRLHTRRMPALEHGEPPALDELVSFSRHNFVRGPLFVGDAELRFHASPWEELDLLQPHEVLGATYTTTASTWDGGQRIR